MMSSHRDRLPVPAPPRGDISPWSVLKQSVGKELTRVTMPVAFNEPLSFLQRITENMEYYPLLVQADNNDDPVTRFELVTAFIISNLSSNLDRLNKPFNPLQGETFELQRDDYSVVCEQVSHHPPVSALHATSPHIIFEANICPKLRFLGTQVTIKPEGKMSLTLRRHDETYTWDHVSCVIHNILVGKLWFEQQGEMHIACTQSQLRAIIKFKQAGPDMRDLHRFEGYVTDDDDRKIRCIYGKWPESVKACPHHDVEHSPRRTPEGTSKMYAKLNSFTRSLTVGATHSKDLTAEEDSLSYPNSRVVWESQTKPPHSKEYYHFTLFAMSLNELPDKEEDRRKLPRTDCRFRPDIRKLEEGDLDGAAEEKIRLEELQRERQKAVKKSWSPLWFRDNADGSWTFTGDYWKRDFAAVPDIF
ncbi:oxysterol-binding protein-related protein 2-like isoform X1 [Varroa destructor]|uniref:Oxysterol-binding protein n=1 Tax=Varroa destructor TaxID=109461 RepID=A0A7M7J100_VARDE|nr:oxysterol-binding protein-related protein 2-like isoform X1 [Varroa destructor]XP_022645388.1 oxysterol-binding protein-related protein 2-like isoform X1 [Varroa destructor]XP_022645389.1 oxysterol-binding protein-related protein 2-like isoform X1 [Varroa destructor]